jgi:hypothetical protein
MEQSTEQEQKQKQQIKPLTQDEFNELQRINLIMARVNYDAKNARFLLNLKREQEGWSKEYIR